MEMLLNRTCPSENMADNDPSAFWDHGPHFDAHRIGWTVSGAFAFVATVVSIYLIIKHSQYYHRPDCQRHIIRIILIIPIYAVISWLSYRFFHYSIYFEAVRDCYEAFVIAAFFALLTQYVEDSTEETKEILNNIEKKSCPFPLGCYRYRPTSERFLHMAKWGILQYVVLYPLITLAILITEAFGVYCVESMRFVFAQVYLKSAQLLSVTVALYALVVFYNAISDAIASEKPFFKLLCVKMVVFFSFWQALILSVLASIGLIHETQYWTRSNIGRGINSLLICFEMMIFAILHIYAFPYKPFRDFGNRVRTPLFKGIIDAFNPIDTLREIVFVTQKVWDIIKQRHTKASPEKGQFDIHRAVSLKYQKHKYQNLEA
ncbi:organic solute transporter Ostalpha-domain-containing protein [Gigaspora margarita]|uniref:Organic solute transporter Ostalpha-domain-containing protein n=1 Tax=Gigaspora margarita TaxID=4874 RepID=A0A8H4AXD8_GIGMA|nr:organic solute transporter Ostalpha-domain-containing protein [Gigaspora margarita]